MYHIWMHSALSILDLHYVWVVSYEDIIAQESHYLQVYQ